MNCTNCDTEFTLKFCPNCAQPANLKRIDGKYIIHEIEHVLHFDRGILFTIKELMINPGENIRNYLSENRSRLVKPVIFIILTSLIYTLISHFFHLEDEYIKYDGLSAKSTFVKILKWLQGNYGYMNIMSGAFIAIWLKILFRKKGFNFFELLIMLCFAMGIPMLIYAFFAIIEGIFHIKLLNIAGLLGVIYLTWAIGNFFDKNKISSYLKALASYILGMVTFFLLITAIGISVDQLIKN